METPCKKICVIDPATQVCTGCWRTLTEIANWTRYSDEQRAIIMAALSDRERKSATALHSEN